MNPAKKKGKKAKRSAKQIAAAKRNIKKAQKALRAKRAGKKASTPKKKAKKKRAKKAKKAKKKGKKKGKKASKKKAKKGHKKKKAKAKKKKAKKAHRGKKHRPVMYEGRTKKGKKVLKHSKKSKLARKGFRFNPVAGVRPVRKYMVPMKGARIDVPHVVGGIGGFLVAGYAGGTLGNWAKQQWGNDMIASGASLVGNYLGAEIPAVAVNWVLHKAKAAKVAENVARGMRIGGYLALILNAGGMVLRAIGINIPYRELSTYSPKIDVVLSGIGDMDLAVRGLAGLGQNFVSTMDYAALSDEAALDAEIAALSAYIGEEDIGLSDVVDETGLSV